MTYENGIFFFFQSGLQEKREPRVMAEMELCGFTQLIILAVRTQTHTHTGARARTLALPPAPVSWGKKARQPSSLALSSGLSD